MPSKLGGWDSHGLGLATILAAKPVDKESELSRDSSCEYHTGEVRSLSTQA